MDAYLTRDAARTLRALALFPAAEAEGFLLGHKRGPRYIIEKVLPTEKGFFPSLTSFIQADETLGGAVIGFFSLKPAPARLKRILAPFALGLIFLDAFSFKAKSAKSRPVRVPKAFVVDFERAFRLAPIPCIVEKEARRG